MKVNFNQCFQLSTHSYKYDLIIVKSQNRNKYKNYSGSDYQKRKMWSRGSVIKHYTVSQKKFQYLDFKTKILQ